MLGDRMVRLVTMLMRKRTDGPSASAAPTADTIDAGTIVQDLIEIADYIKRLKQAIAHLRANELRCDRLPMAHDELGSVVSATASATNRIMEVAEGILSIEDDTLEGYRAKVEAGIFQIFEACTFQDITGQRIAKVVDALGQVEERLTHFASVVKVSDGEVDPEEARRKARREELLLNGPQLKGPETPQDAIDALFA
ncbi:protein phosphatase CheZ [Methylobacterium nodulans]|uniref:Putative chemotaxis phosphatase, CheZ n=1 Tax=Methylobacterium nodulans (strain LMG 21967 / CNCM I-2342 / ORS 2060) TaxID=460265 RepID=B8IB36_METNO|nr:protein phosphatase CheZ [Methylobacterium nodulans]ACL55429.1 putative chemotaxis phosphatase, CheZ [Methylobacterium nodulans ORS 2060]